MRTQFTVTEKIERTGGAVDGLVEVTLSPATDGNTDNAAVWPGSPAGDVKLCYINKATADQLTTGAQYYVDITPVV